MAFMKKLVELSQMSMEEENEWSKRNQLYFKVNKNINIEKISTKDGFQKMPNKYIFFLHQKIPNQYTFFYIKVLRFNDLIQN